MGKPLLKWAGGKGQLLPTIENHLPNKLKNNEINTYVEPFFGGGAVFFYLVKNFNIKKAYLSDINPELVLMYKVIKYKPNELMNELQKLSDRYFSYELEEDRKNFYLEVRKEFNIKLMNFDYESINELSIQRASELIFMNRTCFNGLFRVNKNGEFNVPFGKYKNPKILDSENILSVSDLLQIAEIKNSSFDNIPSEYLDNSFIYFDPPYRPLNITSNFTSYSKYDFNDENQIKLAEFYKNLSLNTNSFLMLSNSDPKNTNEKDNFFDNLYSDFEINRILASRMINSKSSGRGKVSELLIKSYKV
ncbi:DNA adenine methylase [Aliarcobacter butzleri]|uniref:DNA adenine methylase n=1 Tax=Aliarcobacter butzleri TaxID=28197 RepID=UPI001EDC4334|nr:DNA adenine methylase [Aliarcobacter butzleri]MCG3662653.1 DNA adenine methylase [Aliarcobacter butzleri]